MENDQIVELIIPIFEKYYQMDMFTIKSSLCGLVASTYMKLTQSEVKERLCS